MLTRTREQIHYTYVALSELAFLDSRIWYGPEQGKTYTICGIDGARITVFDNRAGYEPEQRKTYTIYGIARSSHYSI